MIARYFFWQFTFRPANANVDTDLPMIQWPMPGEEKSLQRIWRIATVGNSCTVRRLDIALSVSDLGVCTSAIYKIHSSTDVLSMWLLFASRNVGLVEESKMCKGWEFWKNESAKFSQRRPAPALCSFNDCGLLSWVRILMAHSFVLSECVNYVKENWWSLEVKHFLGYTSNFQISLNFWISLKNFQVGIANWAWLAGRAPGYQCSAWPKL